MTIIVIDLLSLLKSVFFSDHSKFFYDRVRFFDWRIWFINYLVQQDLQFSFLDSTIPLSYSILFSLRLQQQTSRIFSSKLHSNILVVFFAARVKSKRDDGIWRERDNHKSSSSSSHSIFSPLFRNSLAKMLTNQVLNELKDARLWWWWWWHNRRYQLISVLNIVFFYLTLSFTSSPSPKWNAAKHNQ